MTFFKLTTLLTLLLVGETASLDCGPSGSTLTIAGSTTVQPIAQSCADGYMAQCPGTTVTVEGGGSGAGAARVCADTSKGTAVDIGDLSRQFNPTEATSSDGGTTYQCQIGDTSRKVTQIEIAYDGISVASQAGGDAATCIQSLGGLTPEQLRWIFTNYTEADLVNAGWDASSIANSDGDDSTHLYSELDPSCPATEIQIASPDISTGTYTYFKESILKDYANGESVDTNRPGYFTGTDAELASYLEGNGDAIGFITYPTYSSQGDQLYGAPIKNSAGVYVAPTKETIADKTYNPLGRGLYMNVLASDDVLAEARPYFEYCFSDAGTSGIDDLGYITLSESDQDEQLARLDATPAFKSISNGSNNKLSKESNLRPVKLNEQP